MQYSPAATWTYRKESKDADTKVCSATYRCRISEPCLPGGTCLPTGFAQISPRGSVQIYDDDHISFWDRGGGSTAAGLIDGSKVTIYFHNPELMPAGVLPAGGIARFYGEAAIHKDDPIAQRIWDHLVQPEKDRDPERKGSAVLVRVERSEDLLGRPLAD